MGTSVEARRAVFFTGFGAFGIVRIVCAGASRLTGKERVTPVKLGPRRLCPVQNVCCRSGGSAWLQPPDAEKLRLGMLL
ncbi:hypothetical protein CSUI_006887 [Cystoisospora suis]|uniref:Uncharacterized protein n=1 Tax=Cystoisospora suis TaxID=483139 RepID=A0A2C6KSV4_9APIC|nr:hypothetical protein CSUI_006887 [Cystoisospora suis]